MPLKLEFVPDNPPGSHFLLRCCEGADIDPDLCQPTSGFETTRDQDNLWRIRGGLGPIIRGGKDLLSQHSISRRRTKNLWMDRGKMPNLPSGI